MQQKQQEKSAQMEEVPLKQANVDEIYADGFHFMETIQQSSEANQILEEMDEDFDEQNYKTLSSGVYQVKQLEQDVHLNNQKINPHASQYASQEVIIQTNGELGQAIQQNLMKEYQKSLQERQISSEQEANPTEQNHQNIPQKVHNKVELQPLQKNLSSYEYNESLSKLAESSNFLYPSMMDEEQDSNDNQYQQMPKIEEIMNDQQTDNIQLEKSIQRKDPEIGQERMELGILQELKVPQIESFIIEQDNPKVDIDKQNYNKNVQKDVQQQRQINQPMNKFKKIDLPRIQQINKEDKQLQEDRVISTILGYNKQYFLILQTQVYEIQVKKITSTYIIKRTFADFANLQQMVKLHFRGFILYPFPQKSIEFFTKLKLSMGKEDQKMILNEKRLLELEKYLNYLSTHPIIKTSILLDIFLSEHQQNFQREMNNLQNITLQRERQIDSSIIGNNYQNIKNVVKLGWSFFSNYIVQNQQNQQNQVELEHLREQSKNNSKLYDSYSAKLGQMNQGLTLFYKKMRSLSVLYLKNSQIQNIQSTIDSVLKLSSKFSSSRSYYETFHEWIQDNIASKLKFYILMFNEISQTLAYRESLIAKLNGLSHENLPIAKSIMERINIFDDRFIKDWDVHFQQYQQNLKLIYSDFNGYWKDHCKLMVKIWK